MPYPNVQGEPLDREGVSTDCPPPLGSDLCPGRLAPQAMRSRAAPAAVWSMV